MEHKSGRGGARRGAGRPHGKRSKSESELRHRYQIRLPGYVIAWLRDQEQSAGRIVEAAIMGVYGEQIEKFKTDKGVSNARMENGS